MRRLYSCSKSRSEMITGLSPDRLLTYLLTYWRNCAGSYGDDHERTTGNGSGHNSRRRGHERHQHTDVRRSTGGAASSIDQSDSSRRALLSRRHPPPPPSTPSSLPPLRRRLTVILCFCCHGNGCNSSVDMVTACVVVNFALLRFILTSQWQH